jgi:hypothetical protein
MRVQAVIGGFSIYNFVLYQNFTDSIFNLLWVCITKHDEAVKVLSSLPRLCPQNRFYGFILL